MADTSPPSLPPGLQELTQHDPGTARTGWQYLEHTADIVLHGWGDTWSECFEAVAHAMVGYMTPLEELRPTEDVTFEVTGASEAALLFNYLHELLYLFGSQRLIAARVKVHVLQRAAMVGNPNDADSDVRQPSEPFFLKATASVERWEDGRHRQGTEVKAITKHGLRVGFEEEDMRCHARVVIDI